MLLFKQLLFLRKAPHLADDEYKRKHHLIKAISLELLILNILLIAISSYLHFTLSSGLLLVNAFAVCVNLILLRRKYSLQLCGHLINILCFLMITGGTLWLGKDGASSSTFDWFYISPIIASVTIGIDGLLIYSALAGLALLTVLSGQFAPIYSVSTNTLNILAQVNPVFIFILISTILYNLLTENKRYETLLKEQNFLLSADKQKFHYLSNHDSLTNLPNRAYFNDYLHELMATIDTEQDAITLYFMDLDGFKNINDRYGHEIGDILLLQVSKRLKSCFREHDFLARLGGDEFTAVIKYHPQDDISKALTTRIKNEFMEPFLIKNLRLKCTISIGQANYPSEANNALSLLKIADETMYKNKRDALSMS